MNKRLISPVAIAAFAILEVVLTIVDSPAKTFVFKLFQAFQILGIVDMVTNGTFVTTRYFKISLALVGTFFTGALVTMIHSEVADGIMLTSIAGILISYSIHYLGKKSKRFLDHMKLLTLLILFPLPLIFFRPISDETKEVVLLMGHLIFAITFILFLLTGERKRVW